MHSFQELVAQFEQTFINTLPFPQSPKALYDPCKYQLANGGKRVRPVVCLMTNELFGNINADAWHAASALELFHNFTLVHDDIMDKAPLRRGLPTVHHQYGLIAGILGGDVVAIYAYQELQKIKTKLPEILQLFNRTAIEVCEGQQLDMDFENNDHISKDEYLQMILLKTSVLLAASMKMGALLGGATEGNANKLYEFGKNLGLAFQLRDDYLDTFGKEEEVGKKIGGDILAHKKTFLWVHALAEATPLQQNQWSEILLQNEEAKIAGMQQMMIDTGAKKACEDAIQSYSNKAFEALEAVAVLSKRKEPLAALAQYLLHRNN